MGQYAWVIDVLMILMIGGLTYWIASEGMFGAAVKFLNVMFAGLVTFCFFEPLAGVIDRNLGFMSNFADFVSILLLFVVTFLPLDLLTGYLSPAYVRYNGLLDQIGRFAFAGATAWYFIGILLCWCETAPIHKKFLGYQWRDHAVFGAGIDRYWLAFVHVTTDRIMEWDNPKRPFDPRCDFILRYHDHRGFGEPDASMPGQPKPAGDVAPGGQNAGAGGQPAGAQGGAQGGGRPVLPPPGIAPP